MLRKSVPNNHYRHDDQNPKDRIIGGGHGMARNRASFILIHQNWRTRNDRFANGHGTEGWLVGKPQLHDVNIFSAGFVVGMLGMYIAAWLYGYRRVVP